MFPKRLNLIVGTTESQGLAFLCDDGQKKVICRITSHALRDLIDFHHLDGTKLAAARALVSEIERLASAKYNAARFEENGELLIRQTDLLRFGFRGRARLTRRVLAADEEEAPTSGSLTGR